MKIPARFLIIVLVLIIILPGCAEKSEKVEHYLITDHFDNQNVGIIKGNTSMEAIDRKMEKPKLKNYKTADDGIAALKNGKIEGMILDAYEADYFVNTDNDLMLLLEKFDEKHLSMPVTNKQGLEQNYVLIIDASVSRMKGDGTYDRIMSKHFRGTSTEPYEPPSDYTRVEGRSLSVGVDTGLSQFVTKDDTGEYSGFFVDIAKEIAKDHGAELVLKEYTKDEMIDAILNDEIIFALSDFVAEDEPPENIFYTAPYFDASQYIVILNPVVRMRNN